MPGQKRNVGEKTGRTREARRRARCHSLVQETPAWTTLVPQDQWDKCRAAFQAARDAGVPFLIGGGYALAAYTGRWRNTKDIDLYVLPENRDRMVQALSENGFVDYYDVRPYDRGWIYRAIMGDSIVDVIWCFANRRSEVTPSWFASACSFQLREEPLKIVPPEELLWSKLYVLQGDHSDWPDILNILYAVGPLLDWNRLWAAAGDDTPLLAAVLTVFAWACPSRARLVAPRLRGKCKLPLPPPGVEVDEERRVRLLDSRSWFAGMLPPDKILEI